MVAQDDTGAGNGEPPVRRRHPEPVRRVPRASETLWLEAHPAWGIVAQTLLSGLTIFVIFLLVTPLKHAVVAASLGSTAVTVFLAPHSPFSSSRRVLVGQYLAIPCGFFTGILIPPGGPAGAFDPLSYGVAVVTVALLMELTDSFHPSAAGTALGLAITPEPFLILSVLVGAGAIAVLHRITAPRLLDLREIPPRMASALTTPSLPRQAYQEADEADQGFVGEELEEGPAG